MSQSRLRRAINFTGLGLAALLTTATLAIAPLAPAQADTTPATGVPSTVSVDALPTWQITGVVWDQVVVGNTVYATGNFTKARPPGAARGGPTEITVGNLIAYDIRTGERIAAFNHILNAQGMGLAVSPDQKTLFVGGDFSTVDGQARSKLAAFDIATHSLKPAFPNLTGQVRAIVATDTTLYVGGNFGSAGGVTRTRLASFLLSDNSLTTWAPRATDGAVWTMTMTPNRLSVVIGGQFKTMNTTAVYGMTAVDAVNGTVRTWPANQKIRNYDAAAITNLRTVGNTIYGSAFSQSRNTGNLEGTFTLNADGTIRWVADCLGDNYDIAPLGERVYTSAHSHDCSMINGFPDQSPTEVWHHALAYTEAATQTNKGPNQYGYSYRGIAAPSLLHWFPRFAMGTATQQFQATWTVEGNSDYVVYGGEFPQINDRNQEGLTRFAIKEKSTNTTGPQWSGYPSRTTPALKATKGFLSNNVTLTYPSAWDKDNETLTYEVFRNRGTNQETLVSKTTAKTNFWTLPSRSVSATVPSNGTFTYSVRVTDPLGNELISANSNTIVTGSGKPLPTTNQAPTAAFSHSVTGQQVSFDAAASSDPEGAIAAYQWTFGDGTTGTGAQAAHTYATPGVFTVKLTVTDANGSKATVEKSVVAFGAQDDDPVVVAADAFDRTLATGWGAANTGGSWTTSGSANTFAVGDGAGLIKLNAPGSGPSASLPKISSTDTEVRLDLSSDKVATGGGQYFRTIVRGTATNGYLARVWISNQGRVTLALSRVVNGTETDLGTQDLAGTTYAAGDLLSLRVAVSGTQTTTIQAKLWTGGTEPQSWFTRTEATPTELQQPGGVVLRPYLSGSATNAPVTVSVRNFTVTSKA